MQFQEDPTAAADFLRKAVPLMVERQIPTTPFNYALWYSHVKGDNAKLSDQLLQTFPEAGSYDNEKGEKLFYEYFVKNYLPENEQAQNSLITLLSKLFGSVNKAAAETTEFSRTVQTTMDTLQNSDNPQEIQDTIGELLKDTDAIEAMTRDFQTELQTAKQEVEALRAKLETSEKSALLDELTKIGNRRAFDQGLDSSLKQDQPTCLLLMDLDHFKQCNDTYGHVMGDKILEAMGQILSLREAEGVQVARYGGEEFAVIVDNDENTACELAEKIRRNVEAIRITQKESGHVIDNITISIGVAQALPEEDAKSLKERADQALYAAKEQGRNRVVTAEATSLI